MMRKTRESYVRKMLVATAGFMFVLAAPAVGQSRAQQAVDDLLEEHHGAMVLWSGEGARGGQERAIAIFGTPMTGGETAEEAAEGFLFLYGEAFTDGDAQFEAAREAFTLKNGRTILGYRQSIDGVPVDGSIIRIVVAPHGDGEGGYVVIHAAGHFARPPVGGLPEPVVTGQDALEEAQWHAASEHLVNWAEPQLVVATTSGALADGEARLAWKVTGWSDMQIVLDSRAFWVDAQNGDVFRHVDLAAHFSPTVTGTVTGGATPGTEPDKGDNHRCDENLPVTVPMPGLLVEITNANQTAVLDTATTDDDGEYEFFGTNYPSDAKIRFTWDGQQWVMHEGIGIGSTCDPINLVSPDVFDLGTTFPVVHDHDFNPSPFTEFDTAKVNIHLGLVKARSFVLDHLPSGTYPALDAEVWAVANDCIWECTAVYREFDPQDPPVLFYGRMGSNCDFNRGYSTIVVHEYGHYLSIRMLGIPYDHPHESFHEGFADTLAMLVYGVTAYAENWKQDCSPDRDPLNMDPPMAFDCEYSSTHSPVYDRSMLLSALWLDLAADPMSGGLGLDDARQLFVDWMMLTSGGTANGPDGCEEDFQSAHLLTLIEVLMADDDDNDLSNGTPNRDVICTIFADRLIVSPIGLGLCGSPLHGGGLCAADVDGSGTLDVFDYLVFLNWLDASDPRADWNGDGRIDGFDLMDYANDFEEGC